MRDLFSNHNLFIASGINTLTQTTGTIMPLPCEDGAGSLNNPTGSAAQIGTNNPDYKKYVPVDPCVGSWEITGLNPDACALNDQQRQANYVAESLNISGAPLNIFKLLGVHEQGTGSIVSQGQIRGSAAYPGYPLTGINTGPLPWRSVHVGTAVAGQAWVGVDFGIKRLPTGESTYDPQKPNWTEIGALNITQANTPNEFARQVRVEIADGKCTAGTPFYAGAGTGIMVINAVGINAVASTITLTATSSTMFVAQVTLPDNSIINIDPVTVGVAYNSVFIDLLISQGSQVYQPGDTYIIPINYTWSRAGIFNIIQSPLAQTLNLNKIVRARAVRVVPTLFTGTGSWEVSALDVLDSPPTSVNNIQDLFFNENRDRDYSKEPAVLKAQYSPNNSVSDLSKFGLNILDQYSFTVSFQSMVQLLGRPIVVGDIVEVIPEMQWDHNLQPIRKFLEVTDTSWDSGGFSTFWKPVVYRFSAQQALPSQETRDIFGTLDTQKYLVADNVLTNGLGPQLDITPLTTTEEIQKIASDLVPEVGSNDHRQVAGQPVPQAVVAPNALGQPAAAAAGTAAPGIYVESALPAAGIPYGEGFKLPATTSASDGDYFRLYYPPETQIAPRLYRFSLVKNAWIFQEADRRGEYSSHRPSVRNILQSDTKQSITKK